MAERGSTTEQLRKDIDSGRTSSKIDYPDPAAAPLGTDDEAAGTPPSPVAIDMARREEVGNAAAATKEQSLGVGAAIYTGVLALVLASLSAIAVWLAW